MKTVPVEDKQLIEYGNRCRAAESDVCKNHRIIDLELTLDPS